MNAPALEPARNSVVDVVVIGAGPAGGRAALKTSDAGLEVVLIDEATEAGGQVWRALPAALQTRPHDKSPDQIRGDSLRAAIADSDVDWRAGRRVWSVLPETSGFRIDVVGPDGCETIRAKALVAATGTSERTVPFPGWTLPGVIGLAAATILLKAQHVLPGRRTVVGGAGPLLAAVAAGILKAGGEVAAVVDLNGAADWARAGRAILARPRLAMRGAGWIGRIIRAGVPIYRRHAVVAAGGQASLRSVTIAPVDRSGAPLGKGDVRLDADALTIGNGLVPATEVSRLLRVDQRFDRALGGWVPMTDKAGRTSLENLYVTGDGAGVLGVDAAASGGEQTAEAVIDDLARTAATASALAPGFDRTKRFGYAMAHLSRLRPAQVASIPPETTICRCEDVTRQDIDAAIAAGADDINQLKHFTRCGMGPCQGRFCGDIVGELLALQRSRTSDEGAVDKERTAIGGWTARVPIRPVPFAQMVGAFGYEDIPVPPPAPL